MKEESHARSIRFHPLLQPNVDVWVLCSCPTGTCGDILTTRSIVMTFQHPTHRNIELFARCQAGPKPGRSRAAPQSARSGGRTWSPIQLWKQVHKVKCSSEKTAAVLICSDVAWFRCVERLDLEWFFAVQQNNFQACCSSFWEDVFACPDGCCSRRAMSNRYTAWKSRSSTGGWFTRQKDRDGECAACQVVVVVVGVA